MAEIIPIKQNNRQNEGKPAFLDDYRPSPGKRALEVVFKDENLPGILFLLTDEVRKSIKSIAEKKSTLADQHETNWGTELHEVIIDTPFLNETESLEKLKELNSNFAPDLTLADVANGFRESLNEILASIPSEKLGHNWKVTGAHFNNSSREPGRGMEKLTLFVS